LSATSKGREALALEIHADVARFVLDWEEGYLVSPER
jgi:hypothetical protein